MQQDTSQVQPPGKPVLIRDWANDDDYSIHPMGSQPKRTLRCPDDVGEPYLIPGHAYIFKTAKRPWQVQQLWSEIIASRIGALTGVPVPRCAVAIAIRDTAREAGVLMEFFFGYPGENDPARLIHASEYMDRVIKDKKSGRPHALRTNMGLSRRLCRTEAIGWWARVLTFDALIGNTDRHPDNWGFLVRQRQGQRRTITLAPAFDNGTSLGYELTDEILDARREPARLRAYIGKGTHHCTWDIADDHPAQHIELCRRFLAAHPEAGTAMRRVLQFDSAQIQAIVDQCEQFDVGVPFTAKRAKFVVALIEARRAALDAVIGG